MREIIFDTETTGFDPLNGDRMVEIGCIEMVGRVMTGKSFHAYFNPERAMPSAAEQVHGLSDKFLSDKPNYSNLSPIRPWSRITPASISAF
jgi:DNA polymerase-3 subunit epsilon